MATALTYDDFLVGTNSLPDQLINHELHTRNIEPQGGPVHNKRRQLGRELFDEYSAEIPPKIDNEKVSMDLCKMAQFVFAAHRDFRSKDTNIKSKASVTLRYIRDRLNQMIITSDFENENAKALISTIQSIITPNGMNETSDTNANANENASDSHTNTADNISEQLNNANLAEDIQQPPINENAHANNRNGAHASHGTNAISLDTIKKISKWNIKFTN